MTEEEFERLAAEYSVGSLDEIDREKVELLVQQDARFAALVARWDNTLAPLTEALPPVEPPAHVWKTIDNGITQNGSDMPVVSADILVALKRKLTVWRNVAYGATAVAATLALIVATLVGPAWVITKNDPQYVAMLMDDKGQYGFIITAVPRSDTLLVRTVDASAPPTKKLELWIFGNDGTSVASLGLLDAGPMFKVDVSGKVPAKDFAEGVKLAVTLEPPAGAPSAKNMGPVVFAGKLMMQAH